MAYRGVDMSLMLEYRNRKNRSLMVGVGEGQSWSMYYVASKITGGRDKGIYQTGWAPPYTRYYAGIEYPVRFPSRPNTDPQREPNAKKKRHQLFIGGGLALNFHDGGPAAFDSSNYGFTVFGKDDYFKSLGSLRVSLPHRTLSTWLRIRYQHYTRKGKESWALTGMVHYAPFRPLYQDELYFETRAGNHTGLNVNRALQLSISFSYPIRLWHRKHR